MFGARSGGKGVLLDIGVHTLDLLSWWFGPDLKVDSYRDDSFGGSEAAARALLSRGELSLAVRLSWLAKQRNSYRIEGSEATLEWGVYDLGILTLRHGNTGRSSVIRLKGPRDYSDLASQVISDFCQAVAVGGRPRVTPQDVLPAARLIDACYGNRERFDMPWHEFHGATNDVR
jgi:predicted dehydrogenase